MTNIDRMVGLEVEYRRSSSDNIIDYENEYYNRMREINRLLLPMHKGKTLDTLKTIKNVLCGINSKLGLKLGTYNWATSYGHAFNGLHLHISHKVDKDLLTRNILRVIGKWGITPRVATSWHVRAQRSYRGFKAKKKYTPVHVTPRGTTEIRILDIEYFYNDEILVDIAEAIDGAALEVMKEVTFGEYSWFYQDCYNENLGRLLNVMEKNMVSWYTKVGSMLYHNNYTGDTIDFSGIYDRNSSDFENMSKYTNKLKVTEPTRATYTPTKVVDIFKVDTPTVTKDFMEFSLDSKPLGKLKYNMKTNNLTCKLIHVPMCMAQGVGTRAGGKVYHNIPNDVFLYLGRQLKSSLSVDSAEELDKFVLAKLEELFRLNEGN